MCDDADVLARFPAREKDSKDGKLQEYNNFRDTELAEHLQTAGGDIHNIVAMDLGSLLYSKGEAFKDSLRAHLLVRRAFEAAYEMNPTNQARWRVYFEDCHYESNDRQHLNHRWLDQKYHDKEVKVQTSYDGTGWADTQGDSGDYVFITFKPIDPLGQTLAWYTWGNGADKNAIMPWLPRYIPRVRRPEI